MCIMGNGNDPPAYHPGNFLMKNMNPTNSGLIVYLCIAQYSNGSRTSGVRM